MLCLSIEPIYLELYFCDFCREIFCPDHLTIKLPTRGFPQRHAAVWPGCLRPIQCDFWCTFFPWDPAAQDGGQGADDEGEGGGDLIIIIIIITIISSSRTMIILITFNIDINSIVVIIVVIDVVVVVG